MSDQVAPMSEPMLNLSQRLSAQEIISMSADAVRRRDYLKNTRIPELKATIKGYTESLIEEEMDLVRRERKVAELDIPYQQATALLAEVTYVEPEPTKEPTT